MKKYNGSDKCKEKDRDRYHIKRKYDKPHLEKRKKYARKWNQENKEYKNERMREDCKNLKEWYVREEIKKNILQCNKNTKREEIPDVTPDLIDLKREHLKLTRKIKQHEKERSTPYII
jgi:arginine/lysine/ornithine decarboxylase